MTLPPSMVVIGMQEPGGPDVLQSATRPPAPAITALSSTRLPAPCSARHTLREGFGARVEQVARVRGRPQPPHHPKCPLDIPQ